MLGLRDVPRFQELLSMSQRFARPRGRTFSQPDPGILARFAPTADDAFNYSMWRGYMSESSQAEMLEWCRAGGAEIDFIHTSGYPSPADLSTFADTIRPKVTVPGRGGHLRGFPG